MAGRPRRNPVTGWVLVATLAFAGLVACAHASRQADRTPAHKVAWVWVEEDLSKVPVGTVVNLCLAATPCRTDVVRPDSHQGSQDIALPLPDGISLQAADGWTLRAHAVARDRIYRDTTRVIYHVSIDPPCHCAGDNAYVQMRPVR